MKKIETISTIHLRRGGGGGDPGIGMCVMEYVSLLEGAPVLTDHPLSACPSLRDFAIMLNDSAPSQALRDTLVELAPRLKNSRADPRLTLKRALHLALETSVRVVGPVDAKAAEALRKLTWARASLHRDDPEAAAEQIMVSATEAPMAVMARRRRKPEQASRAERWLALRAVLVEALEIVAEREAAPAKRPARKRAA